MWFRSAECSAVTVSPKAGSTRGQSVTRTLAATTSTDGDKPQQYPKPIFSVLCNFCTHTPGAWFYGGFNVGPCWKRKTRYGPATARSALNWRPRRTRGKARHRRTTNRPAQLALAFSRRGLRWRFAGARDLSEFEAPSGVNPTNDTT
uniref:(northern house mosquito) hypothetical protein n=1 Tax=Culex pipiens TaxID=7175 RepID=A0A8D8AWV6_CULPI